MFPKLWLIFLLSCLTVLKTKGQDPVVELSHLSVEAEELTVAGLHDSAISLLAKAEALVDKYKLYNTTHATIMYNIFGSAWQSKNDIARAHYYFNRSLRNADRYGHSAETYFALNGLTNLHREIKLKDLAFDYHVVKETELTTVMFPVYGVEKHGDSLDITIHAGRYDGITDSLQKIDLYTHYIMEDTTGHDGLNFVSMGRIIRLTNNHCILRTAKSPIDIVKNDIAFVKAYVPASWRSLKLRNMLLNSLNLVDNSRQFLYDYRYFYYFADSSTERQTFIGMHEAVKEVVERYAADTLTNSKFSAKLSSGIFQGENVIAALFKSKPADIALFFNYVNSVPLKYIGNNYKFSETYATWMINKTPLLAGDVKPYLLKFKPVEMRREILKLGEQIMDDNLADRWLDDGMQQAGIENIDEANRTANLLDEAVTVLKDERNSGWANYIRANTERRLYHNKSADSLLQKARRQFEHAANSEGIKWVNNTQELWKRNAQVNAGIQSGHLFSYEIAQSYNPRFFATGGNDNLIKIWDRSLGKEIVTLNNHTDQINALTYSSNGRYFASAGNDKVINIFNAYNYGLIYSIKTRKAEKAISFSSDNELLASAGLDSVIKIRDFKKDSVVQVLKRHKGIVYDICFHPSYTTSIFSAGADSMVYKWDTETGEMTRWYRVKGKAISVKLSNDGQHMSVVSTDSILSLWNLQTNRKVATYRISVFKEGINNYFAEEAFSPDSRYLVFPIKKDSFSVVRLRDRMQRDYNTVNKYNYLADFQFSTDGRALFARSNGGAALTIYNFAGFDLEHNSSISWKEIKSYANAVVAVQFIANDNKLAVLHSGTSKIDLRNGKTEHVFLGAMPMENRSMFLKDEKKAISFDAVDPSFRIYEYAQQKYSASYSLPLQETVASFELSRDNRYAFLGGHFGYLYGWNIETGEKLFGKEYTEMKRKKLHRMFFDDYRQHLIAVTDSIIFVLDINNGSILREIPLPGVSYALTSKYFLYAGDENGALYKFDVKDYQLLEKKFLNSNQNPIYQLLLSKDEKLLFARNNYTDLTAIETTTGKILYNIRDHDYEGSMLAINDDGSLLASAGYDSKVKLYEPSTGKRVAEMYIPLERDAIIFDTAGHYLAPKNSLDALLFSYNNNAFTYEQFDVQYNRPDILLRTLKRSDTATINNYYAAYKKRLTKLNSREKPAEKSLQIPSVRLLDKYAVETVTTEKEFELTVECKDNLYPLKKLQVLVNNNPVLGIEGRDLAALKTKSSTQKINIKLSTGPNNIKIFCINSEGGRSLNEQLDIFAKYDNPEPAKTYFFGIGISDYKDSTMNLQYAAKDVRDLANSFDKLYNQLIIDTLINEQVTRENILALRKKLEKTSVNDRVILAITGHGLLSKSFDFYYATWDNDFKNPASRGIRYEDLENLLTDIPARKKLMLIDACHSGALDKEELLAMKTSISQEVDSMQVTGIVTRGVIKIGKNGATTAGNSFEMMQKLFTDLNGNNGAVVISAAGGMEYALESPRWNNGVFTYCVRRGIEDKLADTDGGNFDSRVSVQELQQYVSRKVFELTGGKQQPTNRRENLDFEWFLRY